MSRTHPTTKNRQARSISVQLKCSFNFCAGEYSNVKGLVSHLSGHIQDGLTVICPFDGCSKTFNVKTSFSSHVSRYHRGWNAIQVAPIHFCEVEEQSLPLQEEVANQSSSGEGEHISEEVEDAVDQCRDLENNEAHHIFTQNLALFYLGLQAKYLVPASTVTEIANEMKTLQDIQHECTMSTLSRELEQYGVTTETLMCLGKKAYEQGPIQKALNENGPLTTHHRRLQYYKTHFNYVQPVEVILGYNDIGQKKHYHYIPIMKSLKAMLQDRSAAMQTVNHKPAENDTLSDFTDGQVLKSNDLFASDPDSLKLMLFQDAFEVANPLGSAKVKHKVLAVYFTLGNFFPYQRSAVHQIQLVLLCQEKDCKYFGVNKVFSKLVSDLCELEENGLHFESRFYKGTVACIMGDNLGSHMIGGFTENFSVSEYFCRYCLITKEAFQFNPLNVASLRNPESYNESVDFLESQPGVSMHQGIKSNSIFNKLSFFHVCQPGLPPCLAHDLFEGVVDYDLALCLQFLIKKKKWFSYKSLNDRLKTFPCENASKLNAIPHQGTKLGGHAAQNRWLLRFLPVVMHDRIIDSDCPVWQMVLLLRELVELVCAPTLSKSQIAYMRVLIEEYIEKRQELFPHVTLRPKHHYLLHYADLTLQFGPLIHTWTMHFESKHSYFKCCIRSSKNFKNVTKSLADRHQLFQAYQCHGNLFSPQVQVQESTSFCPELYDDHIRAQIENFGLNPLNSVVTDKVKVCGTTYANGMLVLQTYAKKQLLLGQIVSIVVKSETAVILFLREKSAKWVPELGVYEMDQSLGDLVCTNINMLSDYFPLCFYHRGVRLLHPLKHMPKWSM